MGTLRWRGDSCQAQVRIKQGGVVVHAESQSFTGTDPGKVERTARAWMAKVEADIKKGGLSARKNKSMSLADLISDYRKKREEVKPLRKRVASELDELSAWFGDWRLTEEYLVPDRIINWAIGRKTQEYAGPATILHNLSTLRSVLNSAKPMFRLDVNGDFIDDAIAELLKDQVVGKSQQRERRCSEDEERAIVKEFTRLKDLPTTEIPMHLMVPLAIRFPRRREELCEMLWEDWNPSTGVQMLRDTKDPKVPRTERVPVPAAAREIIKGLPKIDARILPYNPESVSAAFKRCCARLGIEDLRWHDLRHEGISRLFEQGLQIQEVAQVSGHLSWATLKIYTHLRPEDVARKAA
jgi:integrase